MNIVNALLRKLETKTIHPHTLALAQVMEAFKLNTEAYLNELSSEVAAVRAENASLKRQIERVTPADKREGTTILDR